MDKWALAAHNLAITSWYEELFLTWETLREQQSKPGRRQRSRGTLVSQIDRAIDYPMISQQARIFQWPNECHDSNHWAVICSHPECGSPYFGHHPLRKERAVQHFLSHGIHLEDDSEILELFGYKGMLEPEPSLLMLTETDGQYQITIQAPLPPMTRPLPKGLPRDQAIMKPAHRGSSMVEPYTIYGAMRHCRKSAFTVGFGYPRTRSRRVPWRRSFGCMMACLTIMTKRSGHSSACKTSV